MKIIDQINACMATDKIPNHDHACWHWIHSRNFTINIPGKSKHKAVGKVIVFFVFVCLFLRGEHKTPHASITTRLHYYHSCFSLQAILSVSRSLVFNAQSTTSVRSGRNTTRQIKSQSHFHSFGHVTVLILFGEVLEKRKYNAPGRKKKY